MRNLSIFRVFSLLIFSLFVVSCSSTSRLTSSSQGTISTATASISTSSTSTESNQSLTAKVGEEITIKLDENPTTGYGWSYFISGDCNSIKNISDKYEPDLESMKEQLVGFGGVRTFVFSAVSKGSVEITFSYMRPWEKEAIEQKVYKITIN